MTDRERLRATFTEDADLYDRARPAYPPAIFDDLAALTGAGPGARVLEIGCGTGQATVALAERGYAVTAVELGATMAALARRKLARFPSAAVHTGAFEDWPLPPEPFDVVFCATSFHWIDPGVRLAKTAAALGGDGALVTVSTHHIAGGSGEFFARAQGCYERFDPATPPGVRLHTAAEIPFDDEPAGSPHYAASTFRDHEWDITYPTARYLDVLRTYSGHRALSADAREGLLGCIARLSDELGGQVTKRYLFRLRVTRRAQAS